MSPALEETVTMRERRAGGFIFNLLQKTSASPCEGDSGLRCEVTQGLPFKEWCFPCRAREAIAAASENMPTIDLSIAPIPPAEQLVQARAATADVAAERTRLTLDLAQAKLDNASQVQELIDLRAQRDAAQRENASLVEAVRNFLMIDESPVYTLTERDEQGVDHVLHYCLECERDEKTGEHEPECTTGKLLTLLAASDKSTSRQPGGKS